MKKDTSAKNNILLFFKPWLVIVSCALYILLLRNLLADNNSFLYVAAAGIALIILLMVNISILKKQPIVPFAYFENKQTSGWQQFFFVGLVTAVFIVNSLRYYDIMPVILAGEANLVLERADLLTNAWKESPLYFLTSVTDPATYNWGLSVVYAPLKSMLGDAQSTVKIFMILVWAAILMLMLWTFAAWQKIHGAAILLFMPVIINTATLLSVRTYKWQIMAALSCSTIYFLIKQLQSGEGESINKSAIFLGGILLAFCVLTYHATIVYIPLMLVLMAINAFYRHKVISMKIAVVVGIFIIVGVGFLLKTNAYDFLLQRFNDVVINNMEGTTFVGNLYSILSLCLIDGVSWPMGLMFLLGLSAGLARWKADIASRTILTGFFILLALLQISYGLTNLDENAYIVIFITMIILLGVKEFYTIIFTYLKSNQHVPVAIILTLYMTVLESHQFYKIDPSNTIFINNGKAFPYENNQSMYLVMDIKKRNNAVIYFPDISLMAREGGFDNDEIYGFNETAQILKKTRPFTQVDKLKDDITKQLAQEPQTPILIYYNNWLFDLKKALGEWGDGIMVEAVMAPYPNVWVRNEKLSYLAIYKAGQKPDIWPSHHFYVAPNTQETVFDRVRRLARIIRGNDSSNYF